MTCRDVRQRLADDPQAAMQDEKIAEHLAGCKGCQEMLARLEAVDQALGGMGELAPPDEVVQRTLERVEADKPKRRRGLRLVLAFGSASAILIFLATGLFMAGEQARPMFATSADALAGNEEAQAMGPRLTKVILAPPADGSRAGAGRYTLGPPVPVSGGKGGEASGEDFDRGGLDDEPADTDSWGDGFFRHKGLRDFNGPKDDDGDEGLKSPELPEVAEDIAQRPATREEVDRKALEQKAELFWRQGDLSKARQLRGLLEASEPPAAGDGQPAAGDDQPAASEKPPVDELEEDLPDSTASLLESPAQVARNARIVPHMRDGKATGFKVYGVRPGSDMDKLGIKNGDVIETLNGQDLTSPDKALSAYQSLAGKDSFEVGIERRGEKLRLSSKLGDMGRDGTEALDRVSHLSDHEKNLAFMDEDGRKRDEESKKQNRELAKRQLVDEPAEVLGKKTVSKEVAAVSDPKPVGERGPNDSVLIANTDQADTYQFAHGTLKLKATPPGAKIFLDGRPVGTTPLNELEVVPGEHRVELRRQGFHTETVDITVEGGQRIDLALPSGDPARLDGHLVESALASLEGERIPPERLRFIPATGYFRNTYLPGDPRLVWLRERLSTGLFLDGERLALERAAAAYRQPFDPPANDGLAVYLSADHSSLEGPTRMTLQVGLKGSTRLSARRAALNAVLVVDLRALPDEQARRTLWSLADAMAGGVQAGDRFWLVTVGADVAVKVTPGRFEPTAVRRALAQALLGLEGREPMTGGLGEGLKKAYELLAGPAGDQAAPLGSNLVLVASAGSLGEPVDGLAGLAHRWALAGVTTSAVGVAGQADGPGLGELALSGQGRRRLVAAGGEAERVIGDELAACGSAVARAVRLRIRLANGVRLVGVLGSEPLSAPRAERVRQAEQAIDRRVASSMGIAADRGDDEEGIQIVIPAFYAGDDHVILLDVLAEGPGPLADVQVRYKDLVNLTNAVARARLSLPSGQRPAGPLNLNVSKNLLAYRLSEDLDRAAQALSGGRPADGRQALAVAAVRLGRLVEQAPQLAEDPELARDRNMLAGYLKVLGDLPAWQAAPAVREHLVRSLQLAALTKRAAWGIE